MRLLLQAHTEYFNVSAAYVNVTPEAAKRYLGLIERVAKLKEELKEFASVAYLTFWDGSAIYVREVDEAYADEVCDDEIVEVPDDATLLMVDNIDNHQRTECDMLKVWDDRVLWVAYAKHGDDRIETAGLYKDYLEAIAAAAPSEVTS